MLDGVRCQLLFYSDLNCILGNSDTTNNWINESPQIHDQSFLMQVNMKHNSSLIVQAKITSSTLKMQMGLPCFTDSLLR